MASILLHDVLIPHLVLHCGVIQNDVFTAANVDALRGFNNLFTFFVQHVRVLSKSLPVRNCSALKGNPHCHAWNDVEAPSPIIRRPVGTNPEGTTTNHNAGFHLASSASSNSLAFLRRTDITFPASGVSASLRA